MKTEIGRKDILHGLGTPLIEALDVRGITPSFLAKKLKAELEATEIKAFNHGGKLVYSDPLVAWEVRQRARIDAQKLLGLYPAEEHRITGDMIPSRSPEEIKSLQEIARRVAGEVRRGKNTRLISKTKGNL